MQKNDLINTGKRVTKSRQRAHVHPRRTSLWMRFRLGEYIQSFSRSEGENVPADMGDGSPVGQCGIGRQSSLPGQQEEPSFLLTLRKCRNSSDRLGKASARRALNTTIGPRAPAPERPGLSEPGLVVGHEGGWVVVVVVGVGGRGGGDGGLHFTLEETRLGRLLAANLSDSKARGLPSSRKSVSSPPGDRLLRDHH